MKLEWIVLGSLVYSFDFALGAQPEAMDLAKKHNCLSCHAVENKVVGPAWKDVTKKFKGKEDAKEILIERVKNGTQGNWGAVPMPPNVTVKDADIEKLVDFILNLK